MHVILRPSTHPELEPIVVRATLFAIGRQEPPFSEYDAALVAKLSRRHARLFEEAGNVYAADLGSLNGTTCNGEPVKNVPVKLNTGDALEFGGLSYEVEVIDSEDAPATSSETAVQRLVLTPERCKQTLEPIVVSSFPFLFDKSSEVFARHKDSLADVLGYMSLHHAHIFLRDDELYIEDLGSTNGTYVSGRRLREHAQLLKDGDIIALGSDRLVYRVHLLRSAENAATQVPSGIDAVDNPTRTIFVDSPTSFLDVYFVSSPEAPPQPAASDNGSNSDDSGESKRPSSKVRLLGQIRDGFFDGPVLGPTTRRALAIAVLGAAAGLGWWYWDGRQLRSIEAAMSREDYAAANALASDYLASDPDNTRVRELATRAAIRQWVPEWIEQVRRGDFDVAVETAQARARQAATNAQVQSTMTLLAWAAQVRAFLNTPEEGGVNDMIERGKQIRYLLDWWQADTWSHSRTLDQIADALPQFRDSRELVYSDVRQLRSRDLDYEPVIELTDRIESALLEGDLKAIGQATATFAETHPQFTDAHVLEADFHRLQALDGHIEAGRWLAGYQQLQRDPFVTAPFAEHARRLQQRRLPDESTMASYEAAKRAWHQGDSDAALAGLQTLAQGRWPGLGSALEERYRTLLEGYDALQSARGEPDYATRLFEYYASLNEGEDGFLLARLEEEFKAHADAAIRRADDYLAAAEEAWQRYQRAGGIQPEHRLEDRVSAEFAELAGQLKQALESLQRHQRIYRQVARSVPDQWTELHDEVTREVAFQLGSLRNLEVIEPAVRRQKLDALPVL